jgi:hypothetical protein
MHPSRTFARVTIFIVVSVGLSLAGTGCTSTAGAARGVMPKSASSAHVDVRAKSGSRSWAEARQVAAKAEEDLARISTVFAVPNDRRYELFIFDDFEDFHAVTKVPPPIAGFALNGTAFFVLHDPAMAHELGHAVARAKIGQPANLFLLEGLACTMFGPATMASFDVQVKRLLKQNKLPALAALQAVNDLTQWSEKFPDVDLYHTGGSWLNFLFRTRGAAKVKEYYRSGNAEAALGAKLETLEAEWHAFLMNLRLRPEAEAAMEKKFSGTDAVTTIADETFTFSVTVPKDIEARGYSFQWEKDGKLLPEQKKTTLLLLPAQTSDAGTYQLMGIRPGEKPIAGYKLKLEVIDPTIFLPSP